MVSETDVETEQCRIFCVAAGSHNSDANSNSHTHAHTRTHKCKHKHETPVDWRQLRVTVQAACQQSKEQNGFQVVREKGKQRLLKEEKKLSMLQNNFCEASQLFFKFKSSAILESQSGVYRL